MKNKLTTFTKIKAKINLENEQYCLKILNPLSAKPSALSEKSVFRLCKFANFVAGFLTMA